MLIVTIKKELKTKANPGQAVNCARFFKTNPGQYGAGDKFLGLTVPAQRVVAKKYYQHITLSEVGELLASPYHEYRLTGALILVAKYQQAQKVNNAVDQKKIVDFYLKNIKGINNWDLVDLTASRIVGDYLLHQPKTARQLLYRLAKSDNLWSRRISIIATMAFIDQGQFTDTLKLAKMLLADQHDLMHKAVGWMLREVGKKDHRVLVQFLDQHTQHMPRTMLRYAIEKFPEITRRAYLKR